MFGWENNKKTKIQSYGLVIIIVGFLLVSCNKLSVLSEEWAHETVVLSEKYGETKERIQVMYDYYGNWNDVEYELGLKKYTLTEKQLLEAVESGLKMDEITELMCIARRADVGINKLIEIRRAGSKIKEIRNDYIPRDFSGKEQMEFVSDGYGLGYYIWKDPNRQKQFTNYKLSDFMNIRAGMLQDEVRSVLDGRLYNRIDSVEPQIVFFGNIDVYELIDGGEVHIYYYRSVVGEKSVPRVYYLEYKPERKYQGKPILLIEPDPSEMINCDS